MGSCAAPSAKGDDKFITTDYLQQCPFFYFVQLIAQNTIKHVKEKLVNSTFLVSYKQ